MRIFWIGEGKPEGVPQGFRHIGNNAFETHDSHAARELGGKDARWSLSRTPAQKTPPKNDPNKALRAEQKKRDDAAARALARKEGRQEPAPAPEEPATATATEEETDDEGDGEE